MAHNEKYKMNVKQLVENLTHSYMVPLHIIYANLIIILSVTYYSLQVLIVCVLASLCDYMIEIKLAFIKIWMYEAYIYFNAHQPRNNETFLCILQCAYMN